VVILVLLKSVLESIPVYWNSIVAIPKGILDKIRRLSCRYLWAGHKSHGGFHLASWSSIVVPKNLGGWGLKDIRPFARALAGQNIWRLSQGNSLWSRVLHSKYFANLSIVEWFHFPVKSSKGSIMWKALVEAFPLVGKWTVWKIGNGRNVRLGEDPWLGAGDANTDEKFSLSISQEEVLLDVIDDSVDDGITMDTLFSTSSTPAVSDLKEEMVEEKNQDITLFSLQDRRVLCSPTPEVYSEEESIG
jgi:hypothetical protein